MDDFLCTLSYSSTSAKRLQFVDERGSKINFALTPVNNGVAAIQFFSVDFTTQQPVPATFSLVDSLGNIVCPFGTPSSFYITWLETYFLQCNGITILSLVRQKQQALVKTGLNITSF